jgi:nitrate reductase NapAB chaperone NapD
MQIKQFLLIILIAFFSFPAIQASGQCLIDAEYEVSFEHNKGSIQVVFEHSATGVVIELVDLLKSEEGVIQAKKLGTVLPSH